VFVFDKKSVDKFHKPKRKDAMTELLKIGLGHLQCYRHPKLLNVVHGPEESYESLAFASEPLVGKLIRVGNLGWKSRLETWV
jgi:SCY1-like protein 2